MIFVRKCQIIEYLTIYHHWVHHCLPCRFLVKITCINKRIVPCRKQILYMSWFYFISNNFWACLFLLFANCSPWLCLVFLFLTTKVQCFGLNINVPYYPLTHHLYLHPNYFCCYNCYCSCFYSCQSCSEPFMAYLCSSITP